MNVEAVKVEKGFLIPMTRDFLRLGKNRVRLKIEIIEPAYTDNDKAGFADDPWSNPDADLPSADMGIEDLSVNHDYYLYGTPKVA